MVMYDRGIEYLVEIHPDPDGPRSGWSELAIAPTSETDGWRVMTVYYETRKAHWFSGREGMGGYRRRIPDEEVEHDLMRLDAQQQAKLTYALTVLGDTVITHGWYDVTSPLPARSRPPPGRLKGGLKEPSGDARADLSGPARSRPTNSIVTPIVILNLMVIGAITTMVVSSTVVVSGCGR
jgi:hypothetical protein